MKILPLLTTLVTLLLLSAPGWAKPLVVTSIRPLTMIVQAIGGDQIEVKQLLPDTEEPHHYSLRISDKLLLNQADLVIWVGPELESFLVRAISSLNPEKVITAISLADIRSSKAGGSIDPHIWLNPNNGTVIATEVSNWLAAHFPKFREDMLTSQQRFRTETLATTGLISQRLLSVKGLKMLVDHDAFSHFFNTFDIQQVGALKTTSGLATGVGNLQTVLSGAEFDCIVSEPQSDHARVETMAARTSAQTVVIDPLGANVSGTANDYLTLLQDIAASLESCLPRSLPQEASP
ncbi:MAG: hypothetical protein COC20_07010 [Cellvibrionales bacterium]|nr:MAG: hypothetical protein COC20_07010 [Cellvibrionales bacterium]